jgi:hypothetical protein
LEVAGTASTDGEEVKPGYTEKRMQDAFFHALQPGLTESEKEKR